MVDRLDLMAQLEKAVAAKWDGGVVDGYMRCELGLSDEEVKAVKNSLRGETGA